MWYNERYGYIPFFSACMRRIRPKKAASRSSSEGVIEKSKEVDRMPSQIVTREINA